MVVVEKHLKKVVCFQMFQAAAKTAVIGSGWHVDTFIKNCISLICYENIAVFLLFYTIMRMLSEC